MPSAAWRGRRAEQAESFRKSTHALRVRSGSLLRLAALPHTSISLKPRSVM